MPDLTLRSYVFRGLTNAIENGYDLDSDDRAEASDLYDTDADVAARADAMFGEDVDTAVNAIAKFVAEFRAVARS